MSSTPVNRVPDDAWVPWSPSMLADRLGRARGAWPGNWYVVGGWALDLWHGNQTREHEDLEFAVLSADVGKFRRMLSDLEFFAVHAGVVEHLPATATPPPHVAQLWGLDTENACWRVDMMIETGSPSRWVYKRDPAIHAPRSAVVRTSAEGIPYLAPAAVLLFKAKYRREKDEADFIRALPRLDDADRDTLRSWLDLQHPGHAWRHAL